MKLAWVILVFCVVTADKLNKNYLPPPGATFAGGRPEDLQTPLELPKENYSKISIENQKEPVNRGNQDGLEKGIFENGNLDNNFNYPNTYQNTDTEYAKPITTTVNQKENINNRGPFRGQGNNNNKYKPNSVSNNNVQFPINSNLTPIDEEKSINIVNEIPIVRGDYRYPDINQSLKYTPEKGFRENNRNPLRGNIPYRKNVEVVPYNNQDSTRNAYGVGQPRTNPYENISENARQPTTNFRNLFNDNQQNKQNVNSKNILESNNPKFDNIRNRYKNLQEQNDGNFRPRIGRPQAENDRRATIINYDNLITPEGYSYSYDTSNGIHADETGTAIDGVKAKGSYSYIGDDGKLYNVSYTADENGFRPMGDHLPVLPESIRALIDQAAKDASEGIYDDGSYNEEKYGHMRYQGPVDRYYLQMQSNTENRQRKPVGKENIPKKTGNRKLNNNVLKNDYPGDLRSGGALSVNIPQVTPNNIERNQQRTKTRIPAAKYPNIAVKVKEAPSDAPFNNRNKQFTQTRKPVPTFPIVATNQEVLRNFERYPNVDEQEIKVDFGNSLGETTKPTEGPKNQYEALNQNLRTTEEYDFKTMTTIPAYYTSNIPITNTEASTNDYETGYVYIQPKDVFKGESIMTINKEKGFSVEEDYLKNTPGNEGISTDNILSVSKTENEVFDSSITPAFIPSTSPMPFEDTVIPFDTTNSIPSTTSANVENSSFGYSTADDRTTFYPFTQEINDSRKNNDDIVSEDGIVRDDEDFDFKTTVGEDFSGPRRPQTYDPNTGYQY